jgi:flagellar motility protein MotE (MotC chaperone)
VVSSVPEEIEQATRQSEEQHKRGPKGPERRLPVANIAGMFKSRQPESAHPPEIGEAMEQFPTTDLLATMGRLLDTLDEERRRLQASEQERRNLERQMIELRVELARLTERLEAELERREWAEEEAARLIAGAGLGEPVLQDDVAWSHEKEAARRRVKSRQTKHPST